MNTFIKSEFWKDFFKLYENLPETWKISSEEYKNKHLKFKGYQQLLAKLKEAEPDATIDSLKRKINSFRTSYRRELNKIRKSKSTVRNASNVYVPGLWYFENLHFLKDQLEIGDGVSDESEPTPVSNTSKPAVKEKMPLRGKAKPHPRLGYKYLKKGDDEADTLCASWVIRYRKLDPEQQLYANKTIEEVLYQAALGNLNEYSYKSVEAHPLRRVYSTSNPDSPRGSSPIVYNSASPPIDDKPQQFTSSYNNAKPFSSSGTMRTMRMRVRSNIPNRNACNCDQYNNCHQHFNA